MSARAWCDTCGKDTNRSKNGVCWSCVARRAGQERARAFTPEYQRRASALARAAPPDVLSERARRREAAKTPGQRSAAARRASEAAALVNTPEQLAERGRKGGRARVAAMTPEEIATFSALGPAGGYRSGRVRLGQAIARKAARVEVLEADLEHLLAA